MRQFLLQQLKEQSRAIVLISILLFIGGIVGWSHLASGIYPEVTFPRVVVLVEAGDAAAPILLPLVTRPIEEAVSKIPGFSQVRTQTIRGTVETSVEFSADTDIELALQQVRGRVGELRATFPPGANVTIERLMPSVFPVLSYNLISPSLPLATLQEMAMYDIRPRLLQLPGVAQVKVQSALSREFSVEVEPSKLAALRMNLSQLATVIQQTNQLTVVGRAEHEHQQQLVLGTAEVFNAQQLGQIPITARGGTPVTLSQIASVHEGSNDRLTAFSGSGKQAVLISILKQPNGNLLSVAKAVHEQLPLIEASLPPGTRIEPVYDLAQLVSLAIENLRDAILIGILLILVVIFVFLKEWRSTAIAALTIPLTIGITFGIMALGHQTLNLMSLGGMAVAVGLVIDDAIVVIEGIFHKIQLGQTVDAATDAALSELLGPVISSTLTTIVVFAPLSLLEGVVGQFFSAFCFTLSSAVVVSLLVALTIVPVLCRKYLAVVPTKQVVPVVSPNVVDALLKQTLKRTKVVVAVCIIIGLMALPLMSALQRGFMPDLDEGSFVLDYYAQPGTSLADTDRIAAQIETVLSQTPEIQSWSRRTGARLALAASETSRGDILVRLKPLGPRKRSTNEIMSGLRERLSHVLPGVDIELTQILQDLINDLADSPAPIAVKIYNPDESVIKATSIEVGDALHPVRGVVDINTRIRPSATEETVTVDGAAAGRLGMTVSDVVAQVQAGLLGITATSIREREKMIPVRVRYTDSARELFAKSLASVPITNVSGSTVPLGALAKIESKPGLLEIRRENLARLGLVTAHLEGRDLGSAMDEVKASIAKLKLPPATRIAYGGQYASQQTAFLNLSLVFALAILLVYLVLVIQFRSFRTGVPVLLAVPLACTGVFAGLVVTNTPLNISSFMGLILLVGLVVKNGIILLAKTEQHVAEDATIEEALTIAVRDRLRPILMTTVCTLLGLLPLAMGIGAGSEMQKPLAIAVISGLAFSTLITLFVTPSLYKVLASTSGLHFVLRRTSAPSRQDEPVEL